MRATLIKMHFPAFLSFPSKRKVDEVKNDERPTETVVTPWDIELPLRAKVQGSKGFTIGEKIGLASKWEYVIRVIEFNEGEQKDAYVGIFIRRILSGAGPHQPLQAKLDVELLEPNSNDPIRMPGRERGFNDGSCNGYQRVLKASRLENVVVGKLRFKLTFTLFGQEDEPLVKKRKELVAKTFDQCTNDIFDKMKDENLEDFKVKTNDGEVKAVRYVLMARSNYFENEVLRIAHQDGGNLPDTLTVKYSTKAMKILISHMNTGFLPDCLHDPVKMPLELAKEVAEAAKQFGMEGLREYLEKFHPGLNKSEEVEDAKCEE